MEETTAVRGVPIPSSLMDAGRFPQGTVLSGRYRVVSLLGRGGMGEVYLAEDTQLQRRVALKVLLEDAAADPERRKRFAREACAAAALNHPHIVTVHSVEEDAGRLFLTLEYVEGRTLAGRIPPGGLAVEELLTIAIPLADAVAAAHEGGITHRDLKPANVMLTKDGRVKVLDFGLAKLREPAALADAETTAAMQGWGHAAVPSTVEGRILGTVAYMSPEQAEGKPVDHRSDLFSLGIMLYEMATGERPFKGDTDISVLSAILKDTPPSVVEVRPDVPRELARIVKGCLQKAPVERYQSARDLKNDLRRLQGELSAAGMGASHAGAVMSAPRRFRRRGILAALVVVSLAVVAAVGWPAGRILRSEAAAAWSSIRIRQLTDRGDVTAAAISGDGRFVVYVTPSSGQDTRETLWLRQVATGADVAIGSSNGSVSDVAFGKDGDFVYYVARRGGRRALLRVPTVGGDSRLLLHDVMAAAPSPDGTRLAITQLHSNTDQATLSVADAEGRVERVIWTRQGSPTQGRGFGGIAWSPDGRQIAVLAPGGQPWQNDIVVLDVETGERRGANPPSSLAIASSTLAWLAEGFLVVGQDRESALAVTGTPQPGTLQLWLISQPGGLPRRLTHDLNTYTAVSVTADARSIMAHVTARETSIWVSGADGLSEARRITAGRFGSEGAEGLDWTAEGRLLFTSWRDGKTQLWTVEPGGTNRRQLTFDFNVSAATVSPDGRAVAFRSALEGSPRPRSLWYMDVNGENRRQLAQHASLSWPVFESDGESIVYAASEQPVFFTVDYERLWRVSVRGGEPRVVAAPGPAGAGPGPAMPSRFVPISASPDGRWLAGVYRKDGRPAPALVSTDGVTPWRQLPFLVGISRWTRDSRAMMSLAEDRCNIELHQLDGGPHRKLTAFKDIELVDFAWSLDGRQLATVRERHYSDLVLITSDKQGTAGRLEGDPRAR